MPVHSDHNFMVMLRIAKVHNWMNSNPNNEWVQTFGKTLIGKLNATYKQDTVH